MSDPSLSQFRPPPLFVHGMWRTGSTYFWHKFRANPENRAYMEPLHEYLCDMSEQALRDFLPTSITGLMRHPKVDRFYFDEYAFQAAGGVPHFQKYFSYQHYCLDPAAADPLLEAYIQSLLDIAWASGQRPVLQLNRGLLRAGWLAERFQGRTILLLRSPFDMWKSFLSFENNLYFPTVVSMIAGQNSGDARLREIALGNGLPYYTADSVSEEYKFYHSIVEARLQNLYPVFYQLSVVANVHAAAHADVVIDVNHVTVYPEARRFVTGELKRIGAGISLEDCAIPVYPASTRKERSWLSSERTLGRALSSNPNRPRISASRLLAISPGLGPAWRSLLEAHSG